MTTRQASGRSLALLALLAPLAAPAAGADGWAVLSELRRRLEAAPQVAEFRQEFLPAGFSSGDSESGRLTLALPGCLRWDYDEPFAKSYLLCDENVWTWNAGESSGRSFTVDPAEERGLELLRLGVEELRARYAAELAAGPDGASSVRLEPLEGAAGEIVEATLVVAPGGGPLRELSYRDVEGNTTRFAFSGHRALAADAAELRPPAGIHWIAEGDG